MPLAYRLYTAAKKRIRYASLQETRLYFSRPNTTLPSTWLGAVCKGLILSKKVDLILTGVVCAINTNDEEKCITVARHLMRDGGISDSSRMFALLSKLCQSPVSWYTSGPAQKFILRQIKAIDMTYEAANKNLSGTGTLDQDGAATEKLNMDICLLMLYGHILFTSTSYTYAIGEHRSDLVADLATRKLTSGTQDISCVRGRSTARIPWST
jgi:hypothetical protein